MSEELLKPNSDKARSQEPRKEETLRTPQARVKKKHGFIQFVTSYAMRNRDSFLYHVIFGILGPRAIDVADDILKDGIDRMLHPRDTQYGSDYRRERGYRTYDSVSYRNYSDSESSRNSQKYEPMRYDRTPDPRTIEFRDRYQALKVLDDMKEAIHADRFCTIQQFYEFARRHAGINIAPNFTDEHWGWSNLEAARPEMTYNGSYVLRLPPTEEM